MPYIIVARQPRSTARSAKGMTLTNFQKRATTDYDVVSERAVATLEEARRTAREATSDALRGKWTSDFYAACRALPESGGTIGPLPDGTVIEVRRVEKRDLREAAGIEPHPGGYRLDFLIDAYNAAHRASDERHDFEPPGGSEEVERLIASYATALAEHLGYGSAERWLGHTRFVLDEHQCAQLLYELTNDKRYLEEPS